MDHVDIIPTATSAMYGGPTIRAVSPAEYLLPMPCGKPVTVSDDDEDTEPPEELDLFRPTKPAQRPTFVKPGPDRVEVYARRYENGEEIFHAEDSAE